MCNILITAPSLDESMNISGISSLTKTIITRNSASHTYFHFRLGKKDSEKKGLKWLMTQLTIIPRFISYLRRNKIDIIHLNTDLTAMSIIRDTPLAITGKYILGKKVLLHLHGGHYLMQPPSRKSIFYWMIKALLKSSTQRVVLSELERHQIERNYNTPCHIMPNAVEINKDSTHKDFSGKLSFLFMGRIVKAKGIFLITECLAKLEKELHEFEFKIYGSGPDLEEFLTRLASIKGLNYTYCGIAKGQQKLQAFAESHIFLLPSLYGEGLPIAMLESMNHGCVPLVSDDASISTVVQDSQNGFIIKKGSLNQLRDKINQLLGNRDKLKTLSKNAKHTIYTSYNLDQYIGSLNKLYTMI